MVNQGRSREIAPDKRSLTAHAQCGGATEAEAGAEAAAAAAEAEEEEEARARGSVDAR